LGYIKANEPHTKIKGPPIKLLRTGKKKVKVTINPWNTTTFRVNLEPENFKRERCVCRGVLAVKWGGGGF